MDSPRIEIKVGGATNKGHKRSTNQDASLTDFPVFIVADGMGGHSAGDVASQNIISLFQPLTGRIDLSVAEVIETVRTAQVQVSALAESIPEGAGSTLTGICAVLTKDGEYQWLVVNIGDSRVYRFFSSELQQLTHDHSEVQMLIDQGKLLPDEAKSYPRRNVISRAIGDGGSEADYWVTPIVPSDRFLICSDGLSNPVPEEVIAEILSRTEDAEDAAIELVNAALESGAPDNVSVVVVDVAGGNQDPVLIAPEVVRLRLKDLSRLEPSPIEDDTAPSQRN